MVNTSHKGHFGLCHHSGFGTGIGLAARRGRARPSNYGYGQIPPPPAPADPPRPRTRAMLPGSPTWGVKRRRSSVGGTPSDAARPETPRQLPTCAGRNRNAGVYAHIGPDAKRLAIEEYHWYFGGGGPKHGKLRRVAIKHGIKPNTFQTWVGGFANAAACCASQCAVAGGHKTLLPKAVEDAIAALTWRCYEQGRTITADQLLAIATDTAAQHSVVWRVRCPALPVRRQKRQFLGAG